MKHESYPIIIPFGSSTRILLTQQDTMDAAISRIFEEVTGRPDGCPGMQIRSLDRDGKCLLSHGAGRNSS